MIGIYKITNRLNGKSYIGQSIHCGKRLDEHYKGNQLIDEIIQLEGIENFDFQILKEANKEELSLWEDYYIFKYNTLFPMGYNKRWNCKKEDRENFISKNTKKENNTNLVLILNNKEDIANNSMKLYSYLTCLINDLSNMQKRVFQHKNINVSLISRTIGISTNSIKKYWHELEFNKKIIYGNNCEMPQEEVQLKKQLSNQFFKKDPFTLTEEEDFEIWKKLWTVRKKRPCEYYEVRAGHGSRNIPKETLKFLNEEVQISEQDMKLYQFLLTYREIGISKMYKKFDFSMMDLRTFLGKKKEAKNHISIYKSLLLLQKYGLIDFKEEYQLNSKNLKIKHYILTNVGFYVNSEILNCEEEERRYIQQDIYKEIEEYIKDNYNDKDN